MSESAASSLTSISHFSIFLRQTCTFAMRSHLHPMHHFTAGLILGLSPSAAAPILLGMSRETQTATRPDVVSRNKTKQPPLYRVLILNDDFTPMEFVVHVLQKFFHKEFSEANQIMLSVHTQGRGLCGIYTSEIAETKVHQVNQHAKQCQHPLKCVMERAD
jgi:ATP-dependent Clp protease adaptor protein ClpS